MGIARNPQALEQGLADLAKLATPLSREAPRRLWNAREIVAIIDAFPKKGNT